MDQELRNYLDAAVARQISLLRPPAPNEPEPDGRWLSLVLTRLAAIERDCEALQRSVAKLEAAAVCATRVLLTLLAAVEFCGDLI